MLKAKQNLSKLVIFFFLFTFFVLIWSAIKPKEYGTWLLEVGPGLIGFGFIAYYWNRLRLSDFLLVLICIHCCILFLGSKYTYAEVPLGFWMQDWFGFTRNHYDRIGHFIQGVTPTLLAREILLRNNIVNNKNWIPLFCVAIALGFSAFYELIEFAAAIALGEGADSFLGTQGDEWDTQMDMFMALMGALLSVIFMKKIQDRSIQKVENL